MKVWVNIYSPLIGACGHAYNSRELADVMAAKTRIACKEIDVEAGEGLSSPRSIPSTETNHGNSSDRR